MKLRLHLLALSAVLALQPCLGHAQTPSSAGGTPSGQAARRSTMGNPASTGRGVVQTFGFAWGMKPGRGPDGRPTYGYPFVTEVARGSSAARAGLAVGDTVLAVNGRDARLMPLFPNRQPGTRYVLRIRRGTEERELDYTFPRPDTPARR